MSKREILAGATDQTIDIFVPDSSSTVGAGLTGLVFNTSGLTCYYRKGATGTPTALTLATQTVGGAHSDGGFVAVDGTNCPGQYRLDLSDTIVAAAGMVTLYLRGATNMAPVVVEIEVVNVNKFDGMRMGLTALPNANAEAAGGLYTRGTGAGQINQAANGQIDVNSVALSGDSTAADNAEAFFDGTGYAGTNNVIPTVTTVNGLAANVMTAAALATDAVEEIRNAITGGAYALDTDANGRVRIVDGTAAGEINTNAGAIALVDLVTTTTDLTNKGNGSGFTAIPWNAAWDAEVQSEVDDALVAQRLDELLNADSDIDGAAPPTVGSVFHELMSKTAGSFTFDQMTDSLEAIRDRGDAAWVTSTFSITAATIADAVWDETLADHLGVGSTGNALNAAGSAGDPWATALPGAYGAGTAGKIIGDNINATISSRASQASIDTIDGIVDAIVLDTDELQTDWANGGRLDLLVDAILDDTGTSGVVLAAAGLQTDAVNEIRNAITGGAYALSTDAGGMVRIVDGTGAGELNTASGAIVQVDQLGTQAKADVNAELVDVMATDTHAQPGQGTPAATTSYSLMLRHVYKHLRNRKTQTATTFSLYNDDAVTVDAKAAVSDDATTFDFAELVTGP